MRSQFLSGSLVAIFVAIVTKLCFDQTAIRIPSSPPQRSSDPIVATIGDRFRDDINSKRNAYVKIQSQGVLKRDRDTFFWSRFSDVFGSNPNTPYMYVTLPLFGFLLPSPMWHMKRKDAAVLIGRTPPEVEYFSFTTFALLKPKSSSRLPFASLGDSVNDRNIRSSDDGIFAYVATADKRTYEIVRKSLLSSGIPEGAINLMVIPSSPDYGLFEDWTHFEIVLRLFRFKNQTQGDQYLKSNHPFYYVAANHNDDDSLQSLSDFEEATHTGYKTRVHRDNIQENDMDAEFSKYGEDTVSRIVEAFKDTNNKVTKAKSRMNFGPLRICGLDCLKEKSECLGDCPDAAYFGLNAVNGSDEIKMQSLQTNDELHLVTFVNHRKLNASVYGSVAMLTSKSGTIDMKHMTKDVRATSIGVTSFDVPKDETFLSWAFTRNQDHCAVLQKQQQQPRVDGCTVIETHHALMNDHITYCERIYLNPLTKTGPDHATILPARLYHISLIDPIVEDEFPDIQFSDIHLPRAREVVTFDGNPPLLRLLHIIKTGGESLENYIYREGSPAIVMDFSACREVAMKATNLRVKNNNNISTAAPPTCNALATFTSSALCGLNCECCALDLLMMGGGGEGGRFHGTLLRSPRQHVLSQFSHCHAAHHSTWRRALSDPSLYLAELILRMTEHACNSSCDVEGDPNWLSALEKRLTTSESPLNLSPAVHGDQEIQDPSVGRVLVISISNTQSHALTCTKSKGSFGHHFRRLDNEIDAYTPDLDEAISVLHRFEWFGITELFMPSLCLLHYQANKTIPAKCDCDSSFRVDHDSSEALGYWKESRSVKRKAADLDPKILKIIDEQTSVDAMVYASAIRLFLGRLRYVEENTGTSLLKCIQWGKLYSQTEYIPGLWNGPNGLIALR